MLHVVYGICHDVTGYNDPLWLPESEGIVFIQQSLLIVYSNRNLEEHYNQIWLLLRISWWRHQMEPFSALLAICAGNSPVPGEFPTQRPVTPSFDVFFDLRLNKRLRKQSRGWWFETLSWPLWRHRRRRFTYNRFEAARFVCRHVRHDWEISTWNGHYIPFTNKLEVSVITEVSRSG